MLRYIKILLVTFLGIEAVTYGLHNIVNWSIGVGHVGLVLGLTENEIYPGSMLPAITNQILVAIAYGTIITAEIGTGLVAIKGGLDLFGARSGSAAEFHAAKHWALVGCGLAIVTWFCGFIVVGAAGFQMWQHALGDASFNGAFVYSVTAALIYLILNAPEPDV